MEITVLEPAMVYGLYRPTVYKYMKKLGRTTIKDSYIFLFDLEMFPLFTSIKLDIIFFA